MTNPRGIDISDLDSGTNISNLPDDIAFVSLKASEGITEQDPYFQKFYHLLKSEKPHTIRIPYHFFRWKDDGIEQAKNALSRGVDYSEPGTAPLMVDLESNGSDVDEWMIKNISLCIQRVTDFLNYVKEQKGIDCIIYSFDSFILDMLHGHTWPQCKLWISSFQEKQPPFIPGWHYSFWQYSEFGQLNGETTGGHYDLDQFIGTQQELNELANIKNQNS